MKMSSEEVLDEDEDEKEKGTVTDGVSSFSQLLKFHPRLVCLGEIRSYATGFKVFQQCYRHS